MLHPPTKIALAVAVGVFLMRGGEREKSPLWTQIEFPNEKEKKKKLEHHQHKREG